MLTLRAIVAVTLLMSACVIDAEHVRTRLVQVCTSDVPLLLVAESSELSVASVAVDGIGATVDHPDARASVSTLTIELTNPAQDFAFADALHLDFIAPTTGLPPARVVDAPVDGASPWTAPGDSSIDLVGYLTAEALEMRLEIAGPAPAEPFAVLFSACLDVDGIEIDDK